MLQFLSDADFQLLEAVRTLHSAVMTEIMVFITMLGDKGIFWGCTALILCFFPKTRKSGVLMIIALAGTYVISTICLKSLFARVRPCVVNPDALIYPCPGGYSFPSGHSISSFAAAGVLFFRHEKYGAAALALAVLIAFSRVYLYVHFPFDVLTGACLGLFAAWILTKYTQNLKFSA